MPKVPLAMIEGLPSSPDDFQLYKLTQDGGARWQSTNLNTTTKEGFYYAAGTATNLPVPGRPYLIDVKQNANEVIQIAYENQNDGTNRYTRRYSGSTWSAWVKTPLPSEVQLGKIFTDTGKTLSLTSPDLDTLVQSGFFYVTQSINGPSVEFGVTTNGFLDVLVRDHSNVQVKQIFTTFDSSRMFTRINNAGVWTRWKELSALTATTEYIDIPLANGAQTFAPAGYNPQFAKIGNEVFIRGEIDSETAPTGRIIGYLPVGFRPSKMHRFLQSNVIRAEAQWCRWSINTNGAIKLDNMTGSVEGLIAESLAIHTSFLI